MLDVTAKQLVDSVIKIAAERPDFVYETVDNDWRCVNFIAKSGAPSCIIGHALADNGITWGNLKEEGLAYNSPVNSLKSVLSEWPDQNDILFLQNVQTSQDNGTPWGESVALAKQVRSVIAVTKITVQQLVDSTIRIAEENPNYVYKSPDGGGCVYFDPETKQPSCLIGHALADNGITFDDLGELGIRNAIDSVDNVCWRIEPFPETKFVNFLERVQINQDCGIPWGEAVHPQGEKFNV